MIRVLVLEDHALFRQALAYVCDRRQGLRVVGQAGTLEEGLRMASEGFDVAVVDLGMPDGARLVSELRRADPRAGVLGLSRRRGPERHAEALEAGADEVLFTGVDPEGLVGALVRLSDG